MSAYLFPGVIGLLLGVTLHWAGFSRPSALRDALGLRRSYGLRSGLYTLGLSMALTALLCWLAVIDVDGVVVLPLSAGVLAGGVVFGVAAGLGGFTPVTAFAGVGGGPVLEALSAVAGCLLAALALPALEGPLSALQAVQPVSATTLFKVTLDEPFLLGGGFLGQGCAGLLMMAIAACIPSPRQRAVYEAEKAASDEAATVEEPAAGELPADADDSVEATPPLLLPAAAPEETFVALLPGEEPLVVDTQLDDAGDEEALVVDEIPPDEAGPAETPGESAEEEAESEETGDEPPTE